MKYIVKGSIFHCYVRLPERISSGVPSTLGIKPKKTQGLTPPPQVKSWESSPLKAFNDGFKLLNFWVHNGLQLLSGHDVLVGTWKEMPDVESPVCFLEIRMIWCDLCMCDYVCVN